MLCLYLILEGMVQSLSSVVQLPVVGRRWQGCKLHTALLGQPD